MRKKAQFAAVFVRSAYNSAHQYDFTVFSDLFAVYMMPLYESGYFVMYL
jgi:hypothetical protein